MTELKVALQNIVNGEIDQLEIVFSADHSDLISSAVLLPRLMISRSALIRVIKGWRSGIYPPEKVQMWASFIRRGYVPQRSIGGIHPIAIGYDASDEDLIVDIIGRLDEIGDKIDGDIDESEREGFLIDLESK